MKAWYFSAADKLLRHGDGRLIRRGTTHKVDCEPVLCQSGLHGSANILHALDYAPGPYVWRVELGGKIVHGDDKIVATERKYLWGYDASDVLRAFARKCALDVIHLWDAPEVVRKYLETGDESLRAAARDAARAAAWDAARDAARDAAWDAARDAAMAAAWDAARDAARDAAWDAARDAARDAAMAAACAAARDAAWAAARESQSKRLLSMIRKGRPQTGEKT